MPLRFHLAHYLSSQQLLSRLNASTTQPQSGDQDSENAQGNTTDITAQLQNLQLGQPGSAPASNNPFTNTQTTTTTGYNNPFQGQTNAYGYSAQSQGQYAYQVPVGYSQGYPTPYSRRAATPLPGSSYAGGMSGGLSARDDGSLSQRGYGSQAGQIGYGGGYSGPLQDPRSIPRSATAGPGSSRRHSDKP
jgi:hypothetical protein